MNGAWLRNALTTVRPALAWWRRRERDALAFASDLISYQSTGNLSNAPIASYCERALQSFGFSTERLEYVDGFNVRKVSIVGKKGRGAGGLAYFGHTDVVPARYWHSERCGPFQPAVVNGRLYGRGSADMKGSIACILAASSQFAKERMSKPLYITLTADEETDFRGASQVAAESAFFREMVNGEACGIIGESTGLEVVHGHKGYVSFVVVAVGTAAHSSTRDYVNSDEALIPFLAAMKALRDELEGDGAWQDVRFEPPTIRMNIRINAEYVSPEPEAPYSTCSVSFRPMPGQDVDGLISRARAAAASAGLDFRLRVKGNAMWTDAQSSFVQRLVKILTRPASYTVPYATDGIMFQELRNLVVLGPGDPTQAHKSDEWISLEQLRLGQELYQRLIDEFCCKQ